MVVLEHLKVCRMQDDFTNGFDIILGILQEDLFEGTDVEESEERDGNQQDETGSEDILADQTVAEMLEHDY